MAGKCGLVWDWVVNKRSYMENEVYRVHIGRGKYVLLLVIGIFGLSQRCRSEERCVVAWKMSPLTPTSQVSRTWRSRPEQA